MPDVVNRAARVAYAFLAMNWAIVVGLARLIRRHEVWR
jgi:hypothetical protein